MIKIVTYQDSRGGRMNVCTRCEKKLEAQNEWPKNRRGEEYAVVSHGLHKGYCDLHEEEED